MLNSSNPVTMSGPPHFVDLHVNVGESVSIQMLDGNETILRGPATITMVSQHTFPPVPMPVQVPPGHMVQQIVDENGTLRHIILSALNGPNSSSGQSSQSAPVTVIQSAGSAPPVTSAAAGCSQQQPHQHQAAAAGLSASTSPHAAFPFPCCCSCCYCTSSLPAPAAGGLAGPPPPHQPSTVTPQPQPVVATGPLLFPAPAGLNLASVNSSARRRTPSRHSYSFTKQRQNSSSNSTSNNNSSSSSHNNSINSQNSVQVMSNNNNSNNSLQSGTNASTTTTSSPGHGLFSFPAYSSPFHPNPQLVSGGVKQHKSSVAKSANGIHHMDTMSRIIIPHQQPQVNGHHFPSQQQQHLHHQQVHLVNHHSQSFQPQDSDSTPSRKSQGVGLVHNNSHISSSSNNSELNSVVSDLLTKAAVSAKSHHHLNNLTTTTTTSTTTIRNGNQHQHLHQQQLQQQQQHHQQQIHQQQVNQSSAGSSPARLSSSLNGKTGVKAGSVRSSSSGKSSLTSSPLKSSPAFLDTNHCGLINTSSSSVLSSSSGSPNSLDSSYASDKNSETSSDFKSSDSVVGLIPNGIIFTNSSPLIQAYEPETTKQQQQQDRRMTGSTDECFKNGVSHRQPNFPPAQSLVTETCIEKESPLQPFAHSFCETPRTLKDGSNESLRHALNGAKTSSEGYYQTGSSESLNRKNSTSIRPTPVTLFPSSGKPVSSTPASPSVSNRKTLPATSGLKSESSSSSPPAVPVVPDRAAPQSGVKNRVALISVSSSRSSSAGRKVKTTKPSNSTDLRSDVESVSTVAPSAKLSDERSNDSASQSPTETAIPSGDSSPRLKKSKSPTRADNLAEKLPNKRATEQIGEGLVMDLKVESILSPDSQGRDVSTSTSANSSSKNSSRSSSPDMNCDELDSERGHGEEETAKPHKRDAGTESSGEEKELQDNSSRPVVQIRQKSSPKHPASSSLPQIQLLNLTYTALTATSVKLKWSLQMPVATEPHPLTHMLLEKGNGNLSTQHFIAEMLINCSRSAASSSSASSPTPVPPAHSSSSSAQTTTATTTSTNTSSTGSDGSPQHHQQQKETVRTVYQGSSSTCKVLHLQCAHQYSFRVRSVLEQVAIVSNVLTITTPEHALNTKQKGSRNKQQVLSQDHHNVNRSGSERQQSRTDSMSLVSSDSFPAGSSVHSSSSSGSTMSGSRGVDESAEKSDQKRAILILFSFTAFALLIAVVIQHLLSAP